MERGSAQQQLVVSAVATAAAVAAAAAAVELVAISQQSEGSQLHSMRLGWSSLPLSLLLCGCCG